MCGSARISGEGSPHQTPGDMTVPPRTVPTKLLLTTLLALTAAVTMGTAATVFVANDVARRAATPSMRVGQNVHPSLAMRALGRDLTDGALQSVAANRSLAPSVRLAAVRSALFGGCQSTREVLFGATATRQDAVQSMVASIADLPRAATIAPLTRRALELFTAGTAPTSTRFRQVNTPWSATLSWMVPTAVRNRRAFCDRY